MEEVKDKIAKLAELQKLVEDREHLAHIFFMFDQETQRFFMSDKYYRVYDGAKLRVKLADKFKKIRLKFSLRRRGYSDEKDIFIDLLPEERQAVAHLLQAFANVQKEQLLILLGEEVDKNGKEVDG